MATTLARRLLVLLPVRSWRENRLLSFFFALPTDDGDDLIEASRPLVDGKSDGVVGPGSGGGPIALDDDA